MASSYKYDPIGSLGGLFAPAYLYGNKEAEDAFEAWWQKNKKTPPKGDGYYTPPAKMDPGTPAVDKITEALMKQQYYPDTQMTGSGGGIGPQGSLDSYGPGVTAGGYPLDPSFQQEDFGKDSKFSDDEKKGMEPQTQPVQTQPVPKGEDDEDAPDTGTKGGSKSGTKGSVEIAPDDINVNVDPVTGETLGPPSQAKGQSTPLTSYAPGIPDYAKGQQPVNVEETYGGQKGVTPPSIADQNAPNTTPGKSDLAPGPQTALSPPSAPAPVSPVAAPTVSPNIIDYGLQAMANPPAGFPAVPATVPVATIDPWGLSPDEIANNTPNVNSWGLTAPLNTVETSAKSNPTIALDQQIDQAKGKGTSTDTDFSGQSKGTTLDAITEALMSAPLDLTLDPVTGEMVDNTTPTPVDVDFGNPLGDPQAPVSLDIDYGYGDLAPVGDPVSVDLGDLGGGTGGVTDGPNGGSYGGGLGDASTGQSTGDFGGGSATGMGGIGSDAAASAAADAAAAAASAAADATSAAEAADAAAAAEATGGAAW